MQDSRNSPEESTGTSNQAMRQLTILRPSLENANRGA